MSFSIFTITLATANNHKLEELTTLLGNLPIHLISAADAGFTEAIEETGATLEENALLKARRVAYATGLPALADDTGLEVNVLNREPGVRSARFAGESCSPKENRELLLHRMQGIVNRRARFRCVLAFVEGTREELFHGECVGVITTTERGNGGFGYDSVFQRDGDTRTLSELSAGEKNAVSHRGHAARAFAEYIRRRL